MTEKNPPSRRLGYARVSTYGQTLDAQLEQLRKEGCNPIYREKASGAQPTRRELLRMLKALGSGDVVTVTRIDRPRALDLRPVRHRQADRGRPGRNSGHWPSRGPTPPSARGG
jgi:predicted site-specific integrase-resolvase